MLRYYTYVMLLIGMMSKTISIGQNLIPNGDFERPACGSQDRFMKFEDMFINAPLTFTMDTTDCKARYFVDTTHRQIPSPQSGRFYHGYTENLSFGTIGNTLMRGELLQPLEKDTAYQLEYYINHAPWSTYAFNHGRFCFNDNLSGNNVYDEDGNLTSTSRNCACDSTRTPALQTDLRRVYTNVGYWEKVSDCFMAKGGEQYYSLRLGVLSETSNRHCSTLFEDPDASQYEILDPEPPEDGVFVRRITNSPTSSPITVPSNGRSAFSIYLDNVSLTKFETKPIPDYEVEFCINVDSISEVTYDLVRDDPYLLYHHAQFLWSDGDTDLFRSFDSIGVYTLRVDHTCFSFTYQFEVVPVECEVEEDEEEEEEDPEDPPLEDIEPSIYIPNAFTPNGDGINDVFMPHGSDFELITLQIYDRYGSIIYEGRDPGAAWNGTSRGIVVQPGVYIYLIRYQDNQQNVHHKSGEVTLLD